VSLQTGSYRLGPGNGTLSVRTKRTGAAAKAGHDLLIHVTAWEATLEVGDDPADTSIELTADAASLRVQEGTGGLQSLGDDDKANIHATIDDEVLKGRAITFRSNAVTGGDDGLSVQGELTLAGTTRPLTFELAVADDGRLSGAAVVKQTDWGMKPYSTLFGALKVADDVRVEIDAGLPQSS
jgi:polyisoprenoid-binding protein YceI